MNRLAIVALVSLLMLLASCSSKQQNATNTSQGSTTSNPPAATRSTNPTPTQPQGSTNPASGGATNNPSATPPSGSSATTPATNPIATVETSIGTFKIRLYLDQAPVTAGNFVKLVQQHFYDGLTFHRIVPGFVVQGGDPKGDGTGGPGWTIPLEKSATDLKHDRAGIVAMARTQDPNSAGSQFYITLAPTPQLDGKYAVFGQVIDGLDVMLAMGKVATDANERPLQPVVIKKITLGNN